MFHRPSARALIDSSRIGPGSIEYRKQEGRPFSPEEIAEGDRIAAEIERLYADTSPAIYICAMNEVVEVLEEHPEIRFLASVVQVDMDEEWEAFRAAGQSGLRMHHARIDDDDQRSDGRGAHSPDADNVGGLIAFFRQWMDSAKDGPPPSMLIHCMQGKYRSGAAALIAHSMLTGDPLLSARALVDSGRRANANWEMARHADALLGFGGALHRAAVNVPRAVAIRHRPGGGPASDEIDRQVTDALRNTAFRVVARSADSRNPTPIIAWGFTDLHIAAVQGDVAGIAALLAAGAPVDAPDAQGRTALHLAVMEERYGAAHGLLDGGAAIDVKDADGKAPRAYASNDWARREWYGFDRDRDLLYWRLRGETEPESYAVLRTHRAVASQNDWPLKHGRKASPDTPEP